MNNNLVNNLAMRFADHMDITVDKLKIVHNEADYIDVNIDNGSTIYRVFSYNYIDNKAVDKCLSIYKAGRQTLNTLYGEDITNTLLKEWDRFLSDFLDVWSDKDDKEYYDEAIIVWGGSKVYFKIYTETPES